MVYSRLQIAPKPDDLGLSCALRLRESNFHSKLIALQCGVATEIVSHLIHFRFVSALLSHDNAQLNYNRRSSYDMAASGMSIFPPSAETRRNTTEPTDRPSVISEAKEMDVSYVG